MKSGRRAAHPLIVKFLVAHRFEEAGNAEPVGKPIIEDAACGDLGGFVLVAPCRKTGILGSIRIAMSSEKRSIAMTILALARPA